MIATLMTSLCLAVSGTSETVTEQTIPALASSSGRLDTLVAAVTAADLVGALSGEGPFTVFAPTDEAFARLDSGTIEALLAEPGKKTLTRILTHHVVAGEFEASDLVGLESVETLAGTTLSLATLKGRLLVDDSIVETANVKASNGVVHLIDRVMLPPVETSPLEVLLKQAISRGVRLYNDGEVEACSAVYATAIDAVILGTGWGLSPQQKSNITKAVENAEQMHNKDSQAWAYRRIIDSLRNDDQMSSTAQADTQSDKKEVFSFNDRSEVGKWQVVLDGVMGGLSTGDLALRNDAMLFTGETSLRNNGGFSSIRCGVPEGTFADADSIKLRVRGDGRDWIVGTRKSNRMGGDSYWKRFNTEEGVWQTVTIPISSMERHFFGQRTSGRITPEEVRGLEFYMYDKKAGPFSLEIDSIEGVRTSA